MLGWSKWRRWIGIGSIGLFIAGAVLMAIIPAFLRDGSVFDGFFGDRPEGFSSCVNTVAYAYDATMEEDGPYSERHVAMRYRRVPVAARKGTVFYRFELEGQPDLFASFSSSGELVRLFRSSAGNLLSADAEAMVLAFAHAKSENGDPDELSVNQRLPSSRAGTVYLHGRYTVTKRIKRPAREVTRCVESSEEDEVRDFRLVELPVSLDLSLLDHLPKSTLMTLLPSFAIARSDFPSH